MLIDGYFEHTRSVWHKEILWALYRGARVVGAASLGALRAVELEPFGMIGVGQVFEWFRKGALEDDDEVALVHESADRGYRSISEAMVNIRATLARAVIEGILSPEQAAAIVSAQKARFYPSRTLDGMATSPDTAALSCDWDALAKWLVTGRVNQKAADAVRAFEFVATFEESGPASAGARRPSFEFAHTDAWQNFVTHETPANHRLQDGL